MDKPIKRTRAIGIDWINLLNTKNTELQSIETKLKNLKLFYLSSSWNYDQIRDFENQACELYIEHRNLSLVDDLSEEITILRTKNADINWLYLRHIKNYDLISQDILNFIENLKFDSKFIYNILYDNHGTNLLVYDIETGEKSMKYLDTPINLDEDTLLIQLPNAQLFCFGSFSQQWASCIIDLKTFSIKNTKIPLTTKRSHCGGVYFEHNIYIFGGKYIASSISYAEKLDLIRKKWVKIPYLPLPAWNCRCAIFKKSILISGYEHQKIYKYDINIESYSEISMHFGIWPIKKILFTGNSRVYMSVDSKIFESEVLNEYKWNNVGVFAFPSLSYHFVFIKELKESVYFGTVYKSYGEYHKFDLNNKQLLKF